MKIASLHWLTLLLLVVQACQAPSSTVPAPAPSLEVVAPAPTVSSPSPSPTVPGDPFLKGVDKAAGATNLAQSAQTPEDWSLVIDQWQRAIAFMKAVPPGSPNRAAAQKLIGQYQDALAQARQQAKSGAKSAPISKAPEEGGTILIAGSPQPTASPSNVNEAIANVNALLQQQTQFFQQKQRFANNLTELGSAIAADTASYTYSMGPVQPKQVVVTAIAKQEGLLSYTGAVFVVKDEKNTDAPVTGICSTPQPAKTLAPTPQIANKTVTCPPGSSKV